MSRGLVEEAGDPGPDRRPDAIELSEWCHRRLGSPAARTLFETGNLAAVTGLVLEDGRRVVVKSRRPAERLAACMQVQQHLWAAGFPCPRPLAGPAPLGELTATAEAQVTGGHRLPRSVGAAARFGAVLARLVLTAPPPSTILSLDPPPAWLRWDHDLPGTWPRPQSTLADLNEVPGPPWLEEAGQRVRSRLEGYQAPKVVGHGDLESQNVAWRTGRLHAVHDWDSAVALPEAVIAGAASAMFPATGPQAAAATLEEGRDFLDAYARRRGRSWTTTELEVCWASGLWVLAYNAKVETVEGGGALLERISRDVDRRLALADA